MEFREDPKGQPFYANVLLFGPPKSGKTAGACSAPGLVGLINCDQANATEYAHERDVQNRVRELTIVKDFKPVLAEVMRSCYPQEGTGFDTWVLDPVGELHRRLLVSRSKGAVRPSIDAYGDVAREVEDFCRFMVEAPCNFVMVCHEHPVKDEESGGFKTLPWTGTTNPSLGQKIMGMVDIIGYTGAVQVKGEDEKRETIYVTQLVPGLGRPVGVRGRFNKLITPEGYRRTDLSEWFEAAAQPLIEEQKEAA